MPTPTITIGGKAFSSNDVQIFFLGRVSRGVVDINWDSKQDINDVHVVGQAQPIDYITGQRSHKAEITILMDELIGLEVSAQGNVLDVEPFDITIVFLKLPLIAQQVLKGFKPKGRALSVKAGGNDALAWKIEGRVADIPELKPL